MILVQRNKKNTSEGVRSLQTVFAGLQQTNEKSIRGPFSGLNLEGCAVLPVLGMTEGGLLLNGDSGSPLLHRRKEGWPSRAIHKMRHRILLKARTGWFSDRRMEHLPV